MAWWRRVVLQADDDNASVAAAFVVGLGYGILDTAVGCMDVSDDGIGEPESKLLQSPRLRVSVHVCVAVPSAGVMLKPNFVGCVEDAVRDREGTGSLVHEASVVLHLVIRLYVRGAAAAEEEPFEEWSPDSPPVHSLRDESAVALVQLSDELVASESQPCGFVRVRFVPRELPLFPGLEKRNAIINLGQHSRGGSKVQTAR